MNERESNTNISAVILAGGRARRMGGDDKGLVAFRGTPLAVRIRDALAPQVSEVLINANRNLPKYRALGCAVVTDTIAGYQGPLAGMHAALAAAAHPWLLTIPCDGPFVRADYAATLLAAAQRDDAPLAVAHDGARMQPVHSLIHRDLASSLARFLESGERKIDRWHAQHHFAIADFADDAQMFTNINTREQLAELE